MVGSNGWPGVVNGGAIPVAMFGETGGTTRVGRKDTPSNSQSMNISENLIPYDDILSENVGLSSAKSAVASRKAQDLRAKQPPLEYIDEHAVARAGAFRFRMVEVATLRPDACAVRRVNPVECSHEELIWEFYCSHSLTELAFSMVRNGFWREEPLAVVPAEGGSEGYVVVDGNRRVAALQLLLNPELRTRLDIRGWPDLTDGERESLRQVPVVVYQGRKEVMTRLGYRHCVGPLPWEALAQARFFSDLLMDDWPLQNIEKMVGDVFAGIRRQLEAYSICDQMVTGLGLDQERVRDAFDMLSHVMTETAVREFLGWPTRLLTEEELRVGVLCRREALLELARWLLGDPSTGQGPALADVDSINYRLGPVLSHPESLARFRETLDLDEAYDYTEGERGYVLRQLRAAIRTLEAVRSVVARHSEDPVVGSACEAVQDLGSVLVGRLRQ